jgi:hypothetical protein
MRLTHTCYLLDQRLIQDSYEYTRFRTICLPRHLYAYMIEFLLRMDRICCENLNCPIVVNEKGLSLALIVDASARHTVSTRLVLRHDTDNDFAAYRAVAILHKRNLNRRDVSGVCVEY